MSNPQTLQETNNLENISQNNSTQFKAISSKKRKKTILEQNTQINCEIIINGFHLNTQGISNKIEKLEILLKEINPLFLLITEHWMTQQQAEVTSLPGYTLISCYSRTAAIHGGAAIFGRNDIGKNCKSIESIKQYTSEFICECAGVSVNMNNVKIAILVIYRSPNSDIDIFLNAFNSILCLISRSHKHLIICGDLNIDCLINTSNKRLLFDLLENFELISTLPNDEPTRDFNNSKAALDYVITNIQDTTSKNLDLGISDHKGQKFITKIPEAYITIQKPKFVFKRNFSIQNLSNLNLLLSSTDLSTLYTIANPNEAWDFFWQNLLYCLDKTCPLIKRNISGHQLQDSWVDSNIVEESKTIKNLYWLSKNINTPEMKEQYNISKKAYSDKIRLQKQIYYQNKIDNASNSTKEIWNVVNSNLGRNKKYVDITQIYHSDKFIYDKFSICEAFCNYFSDIPEQLLNATYKILGDGNCTVGMNCCSSLFFDYISPEEIEMTLNNMPNKPSSGYDEVPIKVIKYISKYLVYPLSYIFNLCIKLGVFPEQLKLAIIIPLFKKGDKELIENYRPIAILSCFSKLFERIIHNRIYKFINDHNLLSVHQHGFRPGHSTNSAAFELTNYIYEALDKNKLTLTLFFDLTRAFDCVNRSFLIKKLNSLGIREPLNIFIDSFLCNRKIAVKLDGQISNTSTLKYGVPQGSVLSPLLFILFINDLDHNVIKELNILIVMFADDTTICLTADSLEELQIKSNTLLSIFYDWCYSNKLIINTEKTKYVMFHKRRKVENITLILNNSILERVASIKFLGLHVDENLTWTNHIDYVITKLNSTYYAIRNLRHIMDRKYLLNIYYSLAYSHIKYLIIYWGQAPNMNRVFILQKRILRLIFFLNPLDTCRLIFKDNNILTTASVFIYESALFVKNNLEKFPLNNNIHNHNTRSSNDIHLKNIKLATSKKNAFHSCSDIYNHLPRDIKQIENFNGFKKALHSFLCKNCFYSLKEFYDYENLVPES